MTKILVVDDDGYIRELVSAILQNNGFDVVEAKDGRHALEVMAEENPSLAVIDIMMPNMDGYELCKVIRRYYEDMPVLMLTAKADISQKVKGFELGTDDYLTKPFEAEELVVRVKALLRRYQVAASQTLDVGKVVVDRNRYTITVEGSQKDIPLKEFELLYQLASFPGKTLTRQRLIDDVWGYDFDGNERTLDVHIGRLRERFPVEISGFKITTIRGLGFRLEVQL